MIGFFFDDESLVFVLPIALFSPSPRLLGNLLSQYCWSYSPAFVLKDARLDSLSNPIHSELLTSVTSDFDACHQPPRTSTPVSLFTACHQPSIQLLLLQKPVLSLSSVCHQPPRTTAPFPVSNLSIYCLS